MPYVKHIYYEETGDGPPIIFIHCPALSHIYWRPILERLQHRFRCIAFDLRGHGKSGLREQPWTFADAAADLLMLTEALQAERPVLVGYSSGSSIALEAALQGPSDVGGLLLVGAFSECSTLYLRAKTRLGLGLAKMGLAPYMGSNVVGTNSVGREHTQAMLPDAKGVSQVALTSILREILRYRCTDRLDALRLPVMLVYGAKDDAMHYYYRLLLRRLPQARALLWPGVDHRVPTRRPAEFADLVAGFVGEITE